MTTTDQFQKLWDAGYHRLVPVVPPQADLHEKSSLAVRLAAGDDSRGKAPGVMRSDGKWRGIQFVAMESHESDLNTWGGMGASVGVKLGQGLVALDIDTTDRASAERLYKLAAEILGPAAVRFGRKPKCLMLYEAPENTAYQQVVFSTPTEDAARVELLSEGRQFVAQGIHPVTGEPYAWPNGIPRRDQLTRISAEQLERFMAEAKASLPNARRQHEQQAQDAPDQDTLKAPDWETLQNLVEALPNTSALFPEREDYVRIAYAIKGAAPEGYEHEALELYLDWCDRWDGGENDADIAFADWQRAKPPFRVGFDHLRSFAGYALLSPVDAEEIAEKTAVSDMFGTAPENQKRRLTLLFRDDIKSLEPPKFAIERHMPEQSLGFLYGPPGCGKSFMALDMAMHIAYGLPDWHGDEIHAKDGWVIYLAGEGVPGFQARMQAWEDKHLTPAIDRPRIAVIPETVNFMQEEDIRLILETVAAANLDKVAMIVVDTVSRVLPGADENLQKEMTLFVNACDALRQAYSCVVLGVHHSGKAGDMRGSSVLKGAGDFVFKLEKSKQNAKFVDFFCEKQKDAEDGWVNSYALNLVTLDNDKTSLVPERMAKGPDADEVHPAVATAILDRMEAAWEAKQPLTNSARAKARYAVAVLSQEFGLSGTLIEKALGIWERAGQIVHEECDARNHTKGFRVVRESPASDISSADESIFG